MGSVEKGSPSTG